MSSHTPLNSRIAVALVILCSCAILSTFPLPMPAAAQGKNLVARLLTDNADVEFQRVNTRMWVPIKFESLIGVGDSVRTNAQGRATLRFMDGSLTLQVMPESMITLDAYRSERENFTVEIRVAYGFTRHQALRTVPDQASYLVRTPGLQIAVLSREVNIRVEKDGRSSALTGDNGRARVVEPRLQDAVLEASQGVRALPAKSASEIVPVPLRTFPALDIALDGCPGTLSLPGDVSLNVRTGGNTKYPRIGGLDDKAPVQVMGLSVSKTWYRIKYKGGYAWINAGKLPLEPKCEALRTFPESYGPEDTSRYTGLEEPLVPSGTSIAPTSTPKP